MRKIQTFLLVLFGVLLLTPVALAQTAGGTVITNQATATYSDGTNSFTTVSNIVTTTVSNVAGIAITPDAGANPPVVAGQTGVLFEFSVANTGNITDSFLFQALGGSIRTVTTGTTTVTVTQAVIDANGSSTIDAGDVDILTNGADVTYRLTILARHDDDESSSSSSSSSSTSTSTSTSTSQSSTPTSTST